MVRAMSLLSSMVLLGWGSAAYAGGVGMYTQKAECDNRNADVFVTYDHRHLPQSASVIIKGDLSRLHVRYDDAGREVDSRRFFSEFVDICFGNTKSPQFRYSIVDVDFNGMRRFRDLGAFPTRYFYKVREKFRSRTDDFWVETVGEEPSNFFSANFDFPIKYSDCAADHRFTIEISGRLTGDAEQKVTKATEVYIKLFNVRMKNSIQAAMKTEACDDVSP